MKSKTKTDGLLIAATMLGKEGHSRLKNNKKGAGIPSEDNGTRRSPVKDIRAFCVKCVGDSSNGRKPLKAVRNCQVHFCPLHPYRMGTNPFRKLDLSEEDRKTRARVAQERFRKKE